MKENLNYTTRQINANFRIKVSGVFNGKKINKLVGVAGALALIGVEMLNKLLKRAFSSLADKCVCNSHFIASNTQRVNERLLK